MQEHFYQKLWFKNTVLISLPVIISVFGVIISLTSNNTIKIALVMSIIFLTICLIVAVIVFSNQDDKIYKEYKQLENNQMELANILAHMENCYKTGIFTISTFSTLSEMWAKNINSFEASSECVSV